jgi:hypothetical protein
VSRSPTMTDLSLAEARTEMLRLSKLLDGGVKELRTRSVDIADAEATYRRARAEAWARCPVDDPGVRAGEREWTAARREAWVDAECAELRRERDLAETMRDSAREALRSRRTQLSAWQSLLRAHEAEAQLARTGP